jgi:hypothetical protein
MNKKTVSAKPSANTHIILIMADGWPLHYPLRDVDELWVKKIQTETQGRVQIPYLDISGERDSRTGANCGFSSWYEEQEHVDIIWGTPDLFYIDLPIQVALKWFVYDTDIYGSLRVCNQLLKEFPEMEAEYTRIGAKRLFGFAGTGIAIQTKDKPVRKLEDLKGLRLSASGRSYEIFNELGAVEVEVRQGEEYTSIARGQADGTQGWVEFLVGFPDVEIVKYTTYLNIAFPALDFYSMKLDKWNGLPPDIRKIIGNSADWWYEEMTRIQVETDQRAREKALARGHEFITMSRADYSQLFETMEKTALRKAAALDAKGLPGTRIFKRTRQLIDEYNRQNKNRRSML